MSVEAGKQAVADAMTTFNAAYQWRARGQSLEAILIQHDIIAAGRDIPKVMQGVHQRMIKEACAAYEANWPLPQARVRVMSVLLEALDYAMVRHEKRKKRDA